MPETHADWVLTRLKHLAGAPITNGLGEAGAFDDPDWPRYIRITDFRSARRLRDDTFRSLPPKVAAGAPVEESDLLLAAVGATFGTSYLHANPDGPACYAGYLVRFRAGEDADPRFVAYWTQSTHYWDQLRSQVIQSTIQNFSASKYRNLMVPTPPLDVQHRIADYLDAETGRIDALIAAKRELSTRLGERIEALISHLTWPSGQRVRSLKHSVDILPGFAFPSTGYVDSADGGAWPLLRGTNVGIGLVRWEDTVYWPTGIGGLQSFELRPGDVVLGLDRPWISGGIRVAQLTDSDTPALLLQRVARLRSRGDMSMRYLFYLLRSRRFLAHFEPEMTGISVPHISTDQVGAFRAPIPSRGEQDAIAARLDREVAVLQQLQVALEQQVQLLEERRSTLITSRVMRDATGSETTSETAGRASS